MLWNVRASFPGLLGKPGNEAASIWYLMSRHFMLYDLFIS